MVNGRNRESVTASAGKHIGKCAVILAAGMILGTLLLTLAYMLPINIENRDASYDVLDKEGWYPRTAADSSGDGYFQSFYPDVLDNFSDRIMLTIAMDSSAGNPLVRAMESFSEYVGSYNYYWHGYVTILRPLLFLLDFSELRILNGVCQMLIIVLLSWLIGSEKGTRYVLALITSYILLNPQTVSMGLQYSWVFYIAYGGTLALLAKRRFFAEKQRVLCFFMILGMLTSYFDMLTYPLFTWGIPLLWWLITEKQDRKETEWIKFVILSGISWIAGYAGMWAAKWVIATLVLQRNIIRTAIDEVFLRSGTAETGMDNLTARWNAIYVNWRHYAYKIYMVILAGWLFWWLFCSLRKKWNKNNKRYAFFLIGMSGPVWYFALSNHTVIHHFFTYRIFGVSILAFFALILDGAENFKENAELSGREKAARLGLLGASVIVAYFCSLSAKEGPTDTNCGGEYQQLQLEQTAEMEMTFPCDTVIVDMDIGLESEGTEGQYEVKLWKGDKLKYRNILYLKNCGGGNLQRFTPWWSFKRGETYRMTVEAVGTDAPVTVWLEVEEDMMLPGLGMASVNGMKTDGQMLAGIHYMNRYHVPKEVQLFMILSWIGIFMAAGSMFWGTNCLRDKKGERE